MQNGYNIKVRLITFYRLWGIRTIAGSLCNTARSVRGARQFSNARYSGILYYRSLSNHIYRRRFQREFRHGHEHVLQNSFGLTSHLINHRFHTQESDKFECNDTRKTIKRIDSRTGLSAVTQFRSYLTPCIAFRLSRRREGVPRAPHRVRTVRGTYCGSCHLYLPNPIFRFVPRWRRPAFSSFSRGTRNKLDGASPPPPSSSATTRLVMHKCTHTHVRTHFAPR